MENLKHENINTMVREFNILNYFKIWIGLTGQLKISSIYSLNCYKLKKKELN
jgi:hypothetical protein